MKKDNTRIPLPYKLSADMSWKCWDDHLQAFKSLVDAVALVCPGITVRSQARYSAFYRGGRIIAYIEPQRRRILFGIFRDYVSPVKRRIEIKGTDFPNWNTSKGGLVGFELWGHDKDLARRVADIAYLIIESYHRA